MHIDIKTVKNHFEKSMDKYNENAIVQKVLAVKLADEVFKTKKSYGKILELGSGTGLLTKEITAKLKFDTYIANDLSAKSKKYLDKILKDYTFICGNAARIKPSVKVDLIVSNAMFQWFENLDEVLLHYRNLLNKDGILAFTTFSDKNFKELKTITGLSLDYKSEGELKKTLEKNYEIIKMESFEQVIEFKTPLELLYHMKNTGVNSLNSTKWTFADVKDFCEKYNTNFDKVTLTYAPILVIARKLD